MLKKRKMDKQQEKDCAAIREQMHRLAKGNLGINKMEVENEYLRKVAEDIKAIADTLDQYVAEISSVLSHLSVGDLLVPLPDETSFYGDFIPIGTALNKITASLSDTFIKINGLMNRINEIGVQSSKTSGQVAENETCIAEEVKNISQKAAGVYEKAEENSGYVTKISDGMRLMADSAEQGHGDALRMVDAMEAVNVSSHNILEVTSMIYAISAKTRILSINASIEAANAGAYGKGFAVVAREIGELAQQTDKSLEQTGRLISESVSRVEACQTMVNQTADCFEKIKTAAGEMKDDSKKIVAATVEQKENLKEMTDSIEKISATIRDNVDIAQESAGLSRNLQTEKEQLENILAGFIVEASKRTIPDKKTIDGKAAAYMDKIKKRLEGIGENDYDEAIRNSLSGEMDVECVYVIGSNGRQASHTVMGESVTLDETGGFKPALPGADHGTKKYFYEAMRNSGKICISHEYISGATGSLCSTYSELYSGKSGKDYVLCVDIKYM